MASYAPLFVNVELQAVEPRPDRLRQLAASTARPSYYVQEMFSANRGDVVLPVGPWSSPAIARGTGRGGIGVGTWRTQAEFKDIKVTQGDKTLFA